MTFHSSIGTLGACIDTGHEIALHCDNPGEHGLTCGFVKYLDLEKLAAWLGRDHGSLYHDLAPHLWCPKCGGKHVALTLHAPSAGIGASQFHG